MYTYTMQPVALDLQKDDVIAVQKALFMRQSQHAFGVKSLKKSEWIGLVLATLISVLGIVFIHGYSRALFWLVLVLCALYLLVRTVGLKWYVSEQFYKQLAHISMPDEMKNMRLSVQPKGFILQMPSDDMPAKNTPTKKGKKRGHMQTMQAPNMARQAIIAWDRVVAWDETDTHFLVAFDMQGQKGTQIIPKRQALPIHTIRKHLSDVRMQGFSQEDLKILMG